MPSWGPVFNMDIGGTLPQTTAHGLHFFLLQKELNINVLHLRCLKWELPCRLLTLSRVPYEGTVWGLQKLWGGGQLCLRKACRWGKASRVYSLTSLPVHSSISCDSWNMVAQPPVPVTMPDPPSWTSSLLKEKPKETLVQAAFGDIRKQ